jgi:hypothetical protein
LILSDRPIFIVGSPRSGTTLMRSILDAHPNIFAPAWETGLFVHLGPMVNCDLRKVMKPGSNFPLTRAEIINWVRQSVTALFTAFAEKANRPRWAEKTPAHVHRIDFIHEVFPKAVFIHMIRNGYDVVKSLQNKSWAPRQIRWSTKTWMDSVRAGRESAKRLPPEQYTEVRYEELIHEPQPVLRRLCDFLGESFSAEMLEFHEPERNASSIALQPLQNKPVNEYRELSLWQRLVFTWKAGRMMQELGYS